MLSRLFFVCSLEQDLEWGGKAAIRQTLVLASQGCLTAIHVTLFYLSQSSIIIF